MSEQQTSTQIDLLRHGECEGGSIFRGSSDVSLSEAGWAKMRAAATKLNCQWDVVVSSPLVRCQNFAKQLSQEQNIPLSIEDDLREMHFGDVEGKQIDEVWRDHKALMLRWTEDPAANSLPNSEALSQVQERVVAALSRIKHQYAGKKVLIVAHGGVIRVIIAEVLSMPLNQLTKIDVPYACISRLQFSHAHGRDYQRLVAHNFHI